ncbi:Rap1a/Tai family immunity protein [Massilia sp. TWR1-2-2]|uniref:Rap1a/Tai family immunity protein n=1 Tax=Massilia sp. TWR1-2-2 TaxID=2804584 RepID=UPI003CE8996A
MKSTVCILIFLSLLTPMCAAQPAKVAPRMTGQQLVDQFLGPPKEYGKMSGRTYTYHQLAQGYLDGINDATEGKLWCYTGRWKPHERDSELILELSKLPAATLKGTAAPLVLEFLIKKYPCHTSPNPNQ